MLYIGNGLRPSATGDKIRSPKDNEKESCRDSPGPSRYLRIRHGKAVLRDGVSPMSTSMPALAGL